MHILYFLWMLLYSLKQFIVPGLEKRFVAKRFFRSEAMADEDDDFIGIDLLYVTLLTHLALMEDEILRLAEVSWFLKEFYRYCRKEYPQITVEKSEHRYQHSGHYWHINCTGIQIAEAYVGTETNTYPSLASGLPRQHTGPGMSWLIEEKRSLSVTKFSGTLQHDGSRHDPISATVYAFSHFALWHSKGTRVFADLQGMFLACVLFFFLNNVADSVCQCRNIDKCEWYGHNDTIWYYVPYIRWVSGDTSYTS